MMALDMSHSSISRRALCVGAAATLLWPGSRAQAREQGLFDEILALGPAFPHGSNLPAFAPYLERYGLQVGGRGRSLHGYVPTPAGSLFTQYFAPAQPRRVVLFLHGYLDHAGTFGDWIQDMLREGNAVVTFDLPGHGLSTGLRTHISDFSEYQEALDYVLGQVTLSLGVTAGLAVGHSAGGAILADALLQRPRWSRTVLVAPLLHSQWWAVSQAGAWFLPSSQQTLLRLYHSASHDRAFAWSRFRDPLAPSRVSVGWTRALFSWAEEMEARMPSEARVLILQGSSDSVVDGRYSVERYEQLFPRGRVQWFEGADHHLLYEAEPWRSEARSAALAELAS
jgi:alpha-beta hydrolase superfamily lysophospholipase